MGVDGSGGDVISTYTTLLTLSYMGFLLHSINLP